MTLQTHTFHITGMHCHACVVLTEGAVRELAHVAHVNSNLKHHTIEVSGDFGDRSPEEVAWELTGLLKKHGYTVSVERAAGAVKWSEFRMALPLAVGFAALFVLLQKLGLVNLVNTGAVSYGTAFVIGVIASLSTCMAVVGGLLLSLSATLAKENDKIRPSILFHAGRLAAFFILGGVIGALGAAFTLNPFMTFILGFLIGLVMLALGINLLDVIPWSRKLQPSLPKFLAKPAYASSRLNHTLAPLLVGIATFFLPCGFTQTMQIYTLGTGTFQAGALTMGFFALGTLPVLSLIGFSSFSIRDSAHAGVFFKTAGLVVILFALYNLMTSLVVIGLLKPIFIL
jgi:sulfite exporter TauE/SafE/copper chaperone CopZ